MGSDTAASRPATFALRRICDFRQTLRQIGVYQVGVREARSAISHRAPWNSMLLFCETRFTNSSVRDRNRLSNGDVLERL